MRPDYTRFYPRFLDPTPPPPTHTHTHSHTFAQWQGRSEFDYSFIHVLTPPRALAVRVVSGESHHSYFIRTASARPLKLFLLTTRRPLLTSRWTPASGVCQWVLVGACGCLWVCEVGACRSLWAHVGASEREWVGVSVCVSVSGCEWE